MPAVPPEARTLTGWALWKKCLMGIIPSAVLIFVVLGTMMLGLATPTEAGAMGAVGAIVLAVLHHKELSSTGHEDDLLGIVAAGAAAIVGMLPSSRSRKRGLQAGLSRWSISRSSGSASRRSAFPTCAT